MNTKYFLMYIRKFYLLIVSLTLQLFVNSQNIQVVYDYKMPTILEKKATLTINENFTVYEINNVRLNRLDTVIHIDNKATFYQAGIIKYNDYIVKDFDSKIVRCYFSTENKSYHNKNKPYIQLLDTIQPIIWELENETRTILNYQVQKAKGYFKGNRIEAWFAKELPYQDGPWKFNGLPGLILEVSIPAVNLHIECTKISKINSTDLNIPNNELVDKVFNWQEYMVFMKKEFTKTYHRLMNRHNDPNSSITVNTIFKKEDFYIDIEQ